MLEIEIPHRRTVRIENVVLDVNGTLSKDGKISKKVQEELLRLKEDFRVILLTADTFGTAAKWGQKLGLDVVKLQDGPGDVQKERFVKRLGSARTAAIGNGYNDRLMLERAGLGIAVFGPEGTSGEVLAAADIVCRDILDVFSLLRNPLRIRATLRK